MHLTQINLSGVYDFFSFLGSCDAPDTTYLQWAADGEHFLTATTAPRLRIGNGYRIFHYSGALLFEKPWPQQEELYEVIWKVINTFSHYQ